MLEQPKAKLEKCYKTILHSLHGELSNGKGALEIPSSDFIF